MRRLQHLVEVLLISCLTLAIISSCGEIKEPGTPGAPPITITVPPSCVGECNTTTTSPAPTTTLAAPINGPADASRVAVRVSVGVP